MTVDEYRRAHFLQTEICSQDVAERVLTLCGSAFSKTTGAQIAAMADPSGDGTQKMM
jgi:hypothetical protein